MKKIINIIFVISTLSLILLLSGCGKKADLIFTEYIEGIGYANAVEIYNPLDDEVDLSMYTIEIYKNGAYELTGSIQLEGILSSKQCYVVVGESNAPEELLEKADLVSSKLSFNGNDPILLKKGEDTVSTIGGFYFGADFAADTTMVKINPDSNLGDYSYIESDWVQYSADVYKYLGTTDHYITLENLEEGPKINEDMLDVPFFPEGTTSDNYKQQKGTGGIIEVKLAQTGDGDTTQFYYPQEFYDYGMQTYTNRVRYYGIDTPESGGSTGSQYQEFGTTASLYVADRLKNATTIHIQSIEGSAIFDTYGRVLALVYVDGVLLNNDIIKMGYSDTAFGQTSMLYNQLPISSYMIYSTQVAKLNGKGIHGEKDPLWDYKTNSPK